MDEILIIAMVKLYRLVYFFILKFSILGQLKRASTAGNKKVFFYEREDTPCGLVLSNFVKSDFDTVVGGIRLLSVLIGLVSRQHLTIQQIYTGNINSKVLPIGIDLVEIQHGLLDESYFHGRTPVLFLARSTSSVTIYKKFRPNVDVRLVSTDLEAPFYKQTRIKSPRAAWIYSKNPGGGIGISDLVSLERGLCDAFPSARLVIHPRDRFVKLIIRHRFKLQVLCSYFRGLFISSNEPGRLVISSYSTALFDKPNLGDCVLNVGIERSRCMVSELVYNDLPFFSVDGFATSFKGFIDVVQVQ